MRLTGPQIHAALGLVGMTLTALAAETGLAAPALQRALAGHATPRESTLKKLRTALEAKGVEFLEAEGVRRRAPEIEVFEGPERFEEFYRFMYAHLEAHGGEICLSCVNENLFAQYRKDIGAHRRRMAALAEAKGLRMRVMATESHFSTTWVEYRWQPAQSAAPTAFYAFGDCLALVGFSHAHPPYVVLHKSGPFAEAYRAAFERAWATAEEPPR